jgi:hypothetical protein
MDIDTDLMVVLDEKGGTSGAAGSTPSTGADDAGERMIAMSGRLTGQEELSSALHLIRQAAADSGWRGGEAQAALAEPEHTEGASGREHALHQSIADAEILFPGACDEKMSCQRWGGPDDAVAVEPMQGERGSKVTVRYLASGPGASGDAELEQALVGAGFRIAAPVGEAAYPL